jgi:hypothetical protein
VIKDFPYNTERNLDFFDADLDMSEPRESERSAISDNYLKPFAYKQK